MSLNLISPVNCIDLLSGLFFPIRFCGHTLLSAPGPLHRLFVHLSEMSSVLALFTWEVWRRLPQEAFPDLSRVPTMICVFELQVSISPPTPVRLQPGMVFTCLCHLDNMNTVGRY